MASVVEKVLAAVRVGPSKTEIREYPDAGHPGGRGLDEDGGRRHLRNRRQALQDAADQEPGDHGPREHRHDRQGRPRVHPTQGLQGRRPGVRGALRRVRQVRVVPSRPVPPLREHRLAQQPRRHPLRLHLGREGAASVGRLRAIRLSSVECGRAPRAEGRDAGTGGTGDADGERRRMVAVRRRRRLQLHRAHPGPGPAGAVADGDLQAGRRLAHHRHRHVQGRRADGGRARSSAPTT